MGNIEQKVQKRLKKKQLQYAILGTVAFAGLLSVALVAPNVLGALAKLGILPGSKRKKEIINRARDRMISQGLLAKNTEGYLSLTKKGKERLSRIQSFTFVQQKPKRWDEKWRILIFDIPQKRRSTRDKIRHTLTEIGFMRLQDSVWVYPYNCEDTVALLKEDFKVGKDLLYLVVDEMEGDTALRISFGLPKRT